MKLSTAPAAERMRLYRHRRRRRLRPVTVEIDPVEIEALVKRGYLGPDQRDDWSEIQLAVSAFLSEQLATP
jgi:hypothetical protein